MMKRPDFQSRGSFWFPARAIHRFWMPVMLALPLSMAGERELPRQPVPPSIGLEEVGHQNVDFEGGFWGPRLEIHHRTTIPHALDHLEERQHVTNFDKAAKALRNQSADRVSENPASESSPLEGDTEKNRKAGAVNNPDHGIVGNIAYDSDVHKALEGACHSLCHHEDQALRQRVDGILERIVAAQQDDGYLVSYFIAKEPENRWADLRTNHEMYNAGHFFEFAVAHHQLTGNRKALDAATRFADHIDNTFGPGKRYDVDGHQGVEMALIKLYRATGEKRYLDLCRFLLDERGHAHGDKREPFTPTAFTPPERKPGLTDYEYGRVVWRAKLYWRNGRMQDHKPVLRQTEAVGHAVRATYMYAAMADIARFDDAPEFAQAVRILWDDVVRRKMYLTGGLGTAQYGDEGFGDPFLLPNKTYCESCACIGNVLWQHRMALLEENAKYADVMELALYNSAIAGLSLTGDGFFYQNPLESRNGAERAEWIGLACCPTNHARFTPQVGGLAYARRAGKLYVNLYAAGRAKVALGNGHSLAVTQATDYPWDGAVRITLDPEEPHAIDLRLRIPGWVREAPVRGGLYEFADRESPVVSASVNGGPIGVTVGEDGYLGIDRTWKRGDVIDIHFPMPVRRVVAHENLMENKGRVAIMRGPVVYCLEGVDQPGVDLFQLELPDAAVLGTEHRADLLHGVTVIHGEACSGNGKPVSIKAIPYYAWANRGKTPMTLWLKKQR
jgi:uncharacterized protein